MTDRELMQMALDALQTWRTMHPHTIANAVRTPTIEALRARLAQPEPEPVAWLVDDEGLYFDEVEAIKVSCDTVKPLYAAPPQREWQGLTDEEISHGLQMASNTNQVAGVRWFEAKLKEKNT